MCGNSCKSSKTMFLVDVSEIFFLSASLTRLKKYFKRESRMLKKYFKHADSALNFKHRPNRKKKYGLAAKYVGF